MVVLAKKVVGDRAEPGHDTGQRCVARTRVSGYVDLCAVTGALNYVLSRPDKPPDKLGRDGIVRVEANGVLIYSRSIATRQRAMRVPNARRSGGVSLLIASSA